MSFLAATLLLNLEVSDAFISFSNLLNRPLLHAFFRLDHAKMADFYAGFEALLKSQLPKVYSHFLALNLTPDLYLQEWIYTLYSRSLPLDLASRAWDVYCRDGDDLIFRIAIGTIFILSNQLNYPTFNTIYFLYRNIEIVRVYFTRFGLYPFRSVADQST